MTWWLRLYPADLRKRYGDELAQMVAESDRPRRDLVSALRHVLSKRLEYTMKDLRMMSTAVAIVIGAVSLVAFGYALAELAGGVRDVPRHWWSALPLMTLAASAVTVVVVQRPLSRRSE